MLFSIPTRHPWRSVPLTPIQHLLSHHLEIRNHKETPPILCVFELHVESPVKLRLTMGSPFSVQYLELSNTGNPT